MQTTGTLALFGLAGLAAAAAVWYFNAPAGAPQASAPRAASVATAVVSAPTASPAQPGPAAPALPVSLAGSTPPRLPLDEHGHLRKVRAVRDFFDYFLTAQNEMPPKSLDALVRKEIAAQLDGTSAQPEALDVWQRYTAYRQALGSIERLSVPAQGNERESGSGSSHAGTADLDAMQTSLDERASLAGRTLGADWNEAFFGPDWRHAHYTLERLRIVRDTTLTDAQKAARLQALEESLPPEERAALARDRHARTTVDTIAKLEQRGMTIDELRAKATQALGPQAAERIVKMQQNDDAWHAKYADYAAQRARIDAMGLSPTERDVQIEQLRQHMFTNPAEALRAASLDR
nr:lipase secretion chaperone [Trinickia acidisoli]